jgi:hypothetical protein
MIASSKCEGFVLIDGFVSCSAEGFDVRTGHATLAGEELAGTKSMRLLHEIPNHLESSASRATSASVRCSRVRRCLLGSPKPRCTCSIPENKQEQNRVPPKHPVGHFRQKQKRNQSGILEVVPGEDSR